MDSRWKQSISKQASEIINDELATLIFLACSQHKAPVNMKSFKKSKGSKEGKLASVCKHYLIKIFSCHTHTHKKCTQPKSQGQIYRYIMGNEGSEPTGRLEGWWESVKLLRQDTPVQSDQKSKI